MCGTLGVSKSGYYNWLRLGPSKRWLENETISIAIHDIFENSFESYGAPRIKVELLKYGHRVSRPRVARLMRANKLFARRSRKFMFTTESLKERYKKHLKNWGTLGGLYQKSKISSSKVGGFKEVRDVNIPISEGICSSSFSNKLRIVNDCSFPFEKKDE